MLRDAYQGLVPLGRYIKQLRRERGLTQSELGGESYSKSYVSALERGSLVPSPRALQFFSAQLHQPLADFEQLLQPVDAPVPPLPALYHGENQHEAIPLLDLALSGVSIAELLARQQLPPLSDELLSGLPSTQWAGSLFLKGLVAQEKGELNDAQLAFLSALPLISAFYRPALLDALGTNSFLMRLYQTALYYHYNALHRLQEQAEEGRSPGLLLQIEMHFGDDYQALGDYKRALPHYEQARMQLRASNNMRSAARIYQGLGYCTYASVTSHFCAEASAPSLEKERAFQSAIRHLIQSRTLYQTSQDFVGASQCLLMHVLTLLDYSALKCQMGKEQQGTKLPPLEYSGLLDDAIAQCRQILLEWQILFPDVVPLPAPMRTLLYIALSRLTRAHVQLASIARMAGYNDTSARERALAAAICQNALDESVELASSWQWVQNIQTLSVGNSASAPRIPALPRLPKHDIEQIEPTGLAEIYLVAGEVAEEIGRAATSQEYALDCYACADAHFQAGLNMARVAFAREGHDPGILARHYQRYVSALEERMSVAPEAVEDIGRSTLSLLKAAIAPLFSPVLPLIN